MSEPSLESARESSRFCVLCVWLKVLAHLSKNSRRLAWIGLLLAPAFLVIDSSIDFLFFNEDGSAFYDVLFHPEPMELYMRLTFLFLFVAFSIYAALLLDRAERVECELRATNDRLQGLQGELEKISLFDPLTGILNRRKFHEELEMSIANALRHHHLFALLMLDIDHFKCINDKFGHLTGDNVLRAICELITSSIRSSDQFFRVGGEEFCLLTAVGRADDVHPLAEKIRKVVESHDFPGIGRVTISIGIAYFREYDTQKSIYARADAALYGAKNQGRNCVASATEASWDVVIETPQ